MTAKPRRNYLLRVPRFDIRFFFDSDHLIEIYRTRQLA
jgi:hypothetical protein